MALPSHLANFRADLQTISLVRVALGVLAIYLSDVFRAFRWALLMPSKARPVPRVLIPSQFVGFTAVALFGRVADLTRPYLVARRTETPVTLQIAVYSLERALDLAAAAILFSVTLLFTPGNAAHHDAFSRAGLLAATATAFLLAIAVMVRTAGHRVAARVRRQDRLLSPKLATALADRILELQAGFATLRSGTQVAGSLLWSLLIWGLIALSYLFTTHCLPGTPQLFDLGLPAVMLLLATSMGASLLQLPILGWFTQMAALAAAYHGFFGAPAAAASLCGVVTFAVNTLSVVPVGLLMARLGGLSLREARQRTPPTNAATT